MDVLYNEMVTGMIAVLVMIALTALLVFIDNKIDLRSLRLWTVLVLLAGCFIMIVGTCIKAGDRVSQLTKLHGRSTIPDITSIGKNRLCNLDSIMINIDGNWVILVRDVSFIGSTGMMKTNYPYILSLHTSTDISSLSSGLIEIIPAGGTNFVLRQYDPLRYTVEK